MIRIARTIRRPNSSNEFEIMTLPTLGTQWRIAGVGDFNGDGYADIVWQKASTGQIVVWLLQNGVLSV
jgi:hypothetical protein